MLQFDPQVHIDSDNKVKYFNDVISEQFTQTNQLLFNVNAFKTGKDFKDGNAPVQIGKVISQGAAVKSLYTDAKVMFSHNYYEKDIEVHPEWDEYVDHCAVPHLMVGGTAPGKCPFGFGAL